jgi:hypothetical protein
LDLLHLTLQEITLNGYKKANTNMPLTETATITKWSPPTTDDMKELLGIVITMGLNPTPSITDYIFQNATIF